MHFHKDQAPDDVWKQYYDETYDGNNYKNCDNCEIATNKNEIYVYQSRFQHLSSSSISITSDNFKFLHSSCFFFDCSNSGNGGAINFDCLSSIVQRRFCTINTFSTNNIGFHSYVNLKNNNVDRQNYIIECSVASCQKQNRNHIIYSQYGFFGIFSSNISKNSVNSYSGFYMNYAKGAAIINFTTFEGNSAKQYICLCHAYSPEGMFEDYKCNIVNNSQDTNNWGIIYANAIVLIKDSTILGPYGKGRPFARNSYGYLYIIDCRVDSFDISTNGASGTFITQNVIKTNDMNILPHLSTYQCIAKVKLEFNKQNCFNKETCFYNNGFDHVSRLLYFTIFVFCDE